MIIIPYRFYSGEVTVVRKFLGKKYENSGPMVDAVKGRVTNNWRDFELGKWLVLSWVSSRSVIDKPTYCASYAVAYYGAKRRAVPSV